MDKIIIKGLKIFDFHGVNPEEKINGQNFEFDIIVHKDLKTPCSSDNLNDTVSYAKIIKTVAEVSKESSYDLIEKVAQRVAEQILSEFEVERVGVTLKKPNAPIKAEFEYVAVEISRGRNLN